MSVEEAIDAFFSPCACLGWPDWKNGGCDTRGCWAQREKRRSIDHLILEVQAAMPCYVWKELQHGSRPCECPSCTARSELAKVSA